MRSRPHQELWGPPGPSELSLFETREPGLGTSHRALGEAASFAASNSKQSVHCGASSLAAVQQTPWSWKGIWAAHHSVSNRGECIRPALSGPPIPGHPAAEHGSSVTCLSPFQRSEVGLPVTLKQFLTRRCLPDPDRLFPWRRG